MASEFTSPYFDLQSLAPGVYAALARREQGGDVANAGLVDLGDSVLAVDSFMLPQSTRDLLRAAQELIGKPVRILVNTHCHADHVNGNYLFPPETTIITTHQTADLVTRRGLDWLKRTRDSIGDNLAELDRKLAKSPEEAERLTLEANRMRFSALREVLREMIVRSADLTFDRHMAVHGTKRAAEMWCFGGGHSPSDVVVHLPTEGILFAGDLLFNGWHPFIADGDPAAWVRIIPDLLSLGAQTIVPGHGLVGLPADLEAQAAYLENLSMLARAVRERGGQAADAAAIPVPEELAGLKGDKFAENMRFLFEHLPLNG